MLNKIIDSPLMQKQESLYYACPRSPLSIVLNTAKLNKSLLSNESAKISNF